MIMVINAKNMVYGNLVEAYISGTFFEFYAMILPKYIVR